MPVYHSINIYQTDPNTKSILVAKCWQLAGKLYFFYQTAAFFLVGECSKFTVTHSLCTYVKRTPIFTSPFKYRKQHHYIELRASMYFHGQQFTCSPPFMLMFVSPLRQSILQGFELLLPHGSPSACSLEFCRSCEGQLPLETSSRTWGLGKGVENLEKCLQVVCV